MTRRPQRGKKAQRAAQSRRSGADFPVCGAPDARSRSRYRWLPAAGICVALVAAMGATTWRAGARSSEGETARPAGRQAAPARPPFDGQQAYAWLKQQVDFGPRVPGTPGHKACSDFLVKTLKQSTPDVAEQSFTQTVGGHKLPMVNVIAKWTPNDRPGVLLAAHWDTRPTADQELDAQRRSKPIPGANDGASGVAVLLELARQLKAKAPPVPVWIVMLDGEDYGPGIDRMFLGSRYLAAHLPAGVPKRGILLDMVGDRDLAIPQEQYSLNAAPDVVNEVYAAAARLGYTREFPAVPGDAVQDDHLPLMEKGLKVIDLIDFTYPSWHTLDDTPDKCSAKSLQTVGEVLAAWVYSR